ncbi:MAG: gliding motility lipoprotein GldH [Bacteroidetes bacterium]|nr:gliding motility lipoprotein GldH [Bacteroidota bacterium]
MITNQRMIRQKPILKSVALFCAMIFLVSACNSDVVYSKYQKFEENEWYSKDKAVFDLDITDTVTYNDISLMVRHADAYPYSNLFLFVTTTYPDGKILTDTMEVILSDAKGKWQGSGAGDIFDFKVPVKKNIRFPKAGKYQFSFVHGMRVDPLPLIMDFGFEIEKSKK